MVCVGLCALLLPSLSPLGSDRVAFPGAKQDFFFLKNKSLGTLYCEIFPSPRVLHAWGEFSFQSQDRSQKTEGPKSLAETRMLHYFPQDSPPSPPKPGGRVLEKRQELKQPPSWSAHGAGMQLAALTHFELLA